jgi:hypothetical protein
VLETCGRTTTGDSVALASIAEMAGDLAMECLAEEDVNKALSMAKFASLTASRYSPYRSYIVRKAHDRLRRIRLAQKLFKGFQDAKPTLAKNADDAQANLATAKFLAFGKDDWEAALAYFARGSNPLQAAAAAAELAGSAEPDRALVVAEAWREAISEAASEPEAEFLRLHVLAWYQSVPFDAGGTRTKAQEGLKQLIKVGGKKYESSLASMQVSVKGAQPKSKAQKLAAKGD